jgi:hypothetical protein
MHLQAQLKKSPPKALDRLSGYVFDGPVRSSKSYLPPLSETSICVRHNVLPSVLYGVGLTQHRARSSCAGFASPVGHNACCAFED